MNKYNPSEIEPKWQKIWDEKGLYKIDLNRKPKFYNLVMFPYPSGDKLHIGHWYNFGPADTYARFKKMQGFNVFEPIGFDAFGLPAENYAIKTKIHPKKSTKENIAYMTMQLKQIGAMYDWSKTLITSSPDYYKWTQWIFLQLYKHGLAYKKKAPANFCPSCQTVLANEQVIGGVCERCDTAVNKKELEQWFFKITDYADRLLSDLKKIDWPQRTKVMQENWIGRSEGLEEEWQVDGMDLKLKTFTTWPHTSFGSTFMVIAPEHPIIHSLVHGTKYAKGAQEFSKKAISDKIKDPTNIEKHKEGFFLGKYVINHLTGRKMPLYIANFAIYDYGTGIVKCTPSHDQRDFEFAKKYKLDFVPVIYPKNDKPLEPDKMKEAYTGEGIMMNAGKFNSMPTEKARKAIGDYTVKQKHGRWTVNYKLRDWLISRQRYWGAPIPIIYCEKCGEVPVPEKDLPVVLPEKVDFKPTGKSPLADVREFVNTKCPKCGEKAKREIDTLDTFVCSTWYFMRYLSPTLKDKPWDNSLVKKWLPVDMYIGGAEHATMHLIYARFIAKVFHDLKLVHFDEPFAKLRHQGIITYKGAKMSKSRGNVVIPDQFVNKYGSDTFRMYLMFMGPYGEGGDWSDHGIVGVHRFLQRVWHLTKTHKMPDGENKELLKKLHQTIKSVTSDLESLRFNTAIASLMEWLNMAYNNQWSITKEMLETYLKLLSPFAPHLVEELWSHLEYENSIFEDAWPKYDSKLIKEEKITIVIQINGKLRGEIEVAEGTAEDEIKKQAQENEKIKKWLSAKKIQKIIYVPGKLINIVI